MLFASKKQLLFVSKNTNAKKILVTCLSRKGIISDCDYDDFNYVLKIGVTAPYMLTKLFLNHFNTDGAIVNISSTRASMSQRDTESYTAAKE